MNELTVNNSTIKYISHFNKLLVQTRDEPTGKYLAIPIEQLSNVNISSLKSILAQMVIYLTLVHLFY